MLKLIKRFTKEEVEVQKKDGTKVKKHLPYYVLQGSICTSSSADGKTVSVIIKPSFNDSNAYATLDLLSEKDK